VEIEIKYGMALFVKMSLTPSGVNEWIIDRTWDKGIEWYETGTEARSGYE